MGKIGDLWVRLGLKKDEFTAGLEQAGNESQTFSQKVGGYFSGLATKTLALIAAFDAIGKGLVEAARNVAVFERANSELAAVLGTNIAGVKQLSDSAKQLGRTTEFTASEVTQLQVALARLGFDTGQIEAMQGGILKFAAALGTDLQSAAAFTGSALRAFGLDARDTAAMLDVFAASTTNSALDFSKLQSSISTVAPIARAFGLDVKETSAFLGVLANNGFDASSAATALRNILLNLADANGKLAKGIGHSARTFPEIIAAFKELKEKGVDVSQILEMTDRRSAAAAAALIECGDAAEELKEKLDGADGSLNTMYDTMTDNVIGSVKEMRSAWEGLTLAFEGSKGPIKWVFDRLTDILNRLTDIITQTDKISGWEVILGPVAGGAIAGGRKRKKETKAAADAQAYPTPGGSGGGGRGEAPAGGSQITMTEEELERLKKKKQKEWEMYLNKTLSEVKTAAAAAPAPDEDQLSRLRDRIADAEAGIDTNVLAPVEVPVDTTNAERQLDQLSRLWANLADKAPTPDAAREAWEKFQQAVKAGAGSMSSELAEVAAADREMAEEADRAYERWRELNGMETRPFNNEELIMYARALQEVIDHEQELADVSEMLAANQDDLNAKLTAHLERLGKVSEDTARAITENLVSAIEDGLVGAFEGLANVIAGVSEGGMEQVVKALLDPLADMAIKAGTLIMLSGEAIQALKDSLVGFFGGNAIIAGAALVAVGFAAKAGLAAIGNRGTGATSVTSYGGGTGYGSGAGTLSAELTVNVQGVVKGSDIILSGQNTLNEWNR